MLLTRPTKWVLVVPEDSPIKDVKDLEGKRIATEGIGSTERYLEKHGVKAALEARDKVGLKMNLPEKNLSAVLEALPSLRRPTSSLKMTGSQWKL